MKDKRPAPYPLRMSLEIREQLENHAETLGRSLNAEIVDRINKSFEDDISIFEVRSASESFKLAQSAESKLFKSLRDMTMAQIVHSCNQGKYRAYIDLRDYEINDPEEQLMSSVIKPFMSELEALGYKVDDNWDVEVFFVYFGEEDIKKRTNVLTN